MKPELVYQIRMDFRRYIAENEASRLHTYMTVAVVVGNLGTVDRAVVEEESSVLHRRSLAEFGDHEEHTDRLKAYHTEDGYLGEADKTSTLNGYSE